LRKGRGSLHHTKRLE
jgi:hypothetical protein